ncbi:MAG: zinc ribbon domain-containing protein [Candidatus Peregrinibacteria bacterium]
MIDLSVENLHLLLIIAGGYTALLWIAITIWIARDAIHRSHSTLFHLFAVVINVIIPFLGAVLYLVFRPSQSLLEKYYQELERRAFGERPSACFFCGHLNSIDAKFCSECGESLNETCKECQKETLRGGNFCEHCGEKI